MVPRQSVPDVVGEMHPCHLCGSGQTATALCSICTEDLTLLGATLPSETSTKEEVQAWAKENKVTVFVCKEIPA
jgi:hypothetical protein